MDDAAEARLLRRAERERTARKEAERLLEQKSRELWAANEALRSARDDLEKRVEQRTEELKRALEAAEEASDAKTRFLAHMSHELRTPLTAILGYTADLVERAPEDADLATVDRNARHLLALINEALDLSRVESGTLEVVPVPTSLHELVADLERTFSPRAASKGLRFGVSVDEAVPRTVRVDGLRLRQILLNLLGNATKFTERGGVALRVFPSGSDGTLRFDVLDTGRGIPPEALDRVFEPFQQVAERDRSTGTGLGLAICHRLATRMGGELTVRSTPGRGSCFTLVVHAPRCASSAAPRDPTAQGIRPLEGMHLLLAEDAPDSRNLLRRWCERAGATVTAVADGAAAIERADGTHDVILMDMQMPVLDGFQATRTLRERGYEGAIVALTARSMEEDRRACEAAGCDRHLAKPVARDELVRCLRAFAPT